MVCRRLIFIKFLFICFLNTGAQSKIVFKNVCQTTNILKATQDSADYFNFEYLSAKQVAEVIENLKGVLKYNNPGNGFRIYEDENQTKLYTRKKLRNALIIQQDSVDVEKFNKDWGSYVEREGIPADSTSFFSNVAAFKFQEDWSIDTAWFTCNINSKSYTVLAYLYGKEDLGPMSFFTIKPAIEQKKFQTLTDLIITDVFVKNDSTVQPEGDTDAPLEAYKIVMLVNSVIDKIKTGKVTAFKPVIPFKERLTGLELQTLLADEAHHNKNDRFQLLYKTYCYRFKMVEKWWFDMTAMAFKKEALGIILMKREEKKDFNNNKHIEMPYTYSPVAYIPFNRR